MLAEIKRELKSVENFSIESIGDIAYVMENKKKMRQLHAILLITGLPLNIIQWLSILLWIFTGIWWPFVLWVLIAVSYAIWVTKFYFKRVAYICPQCHEVFKPQLKEAVFAPMERRQKRMNNFIDFLPFLIPLAIAQLALLGYTLYHILTHKNYKRGNRTLWLIIAMIGMEFIGPILYFLLGKEED